MGTLSRCGVPVAERSVRRRKRIAGTRGWPRSFRPTLRSGRGRRSAASLPAREEKRAAFGLIKGLNRSKVMGVQLAEWIIASHVEKHTRVPRAKPATTTAP